MTETLQLIFENKTFQLSYTTEGSGELFARYIFFNSAPDLLKFAPAEFEIIYSPKQYPNWKYTPAYGDRFDNLRVAIIQALQNKYPGKYAAVNVYATQSGNSLRSVYP